MARDKDAILFHDMLIFYMQMIFLNDGVFVPSSKLKVIQPKGLSPPWELSLKLQQNNGIVKNNVGKSP